jgi:hypothetical protein
MYDGDEAVAAYGLCWADPHAGVGLVEPMRTEGPFQRRGLARAVLTAGLDHIAAAGCERFKVNYEPENAAARHTSTSRRGSATRRPAAHGPEADATEHRKGRWAMAAAGLSGFAR